MRTHDDSLEPSPAEMGDTMTVEPGEWTPLDDHGTQLYIYGEQPVDVAVQTAEQGDEIRRLTAERDKAQRERDALARRCAVRFQETEKLRAEADRLYAALDEIRNLHTDSPAGFCPSCHRAGEVSDTDDGLVAYPCPTIRAIETAVDLATLATRPQSCCDMHNQHCEPPSELCCHACPEAGHPEHPAGVGCVLATAPNPAEAREGR